MKVYKIEVSVSGVDRQDVINRFEVLVETIRLAGYQENSGIGMSTTIYVGEGGLGGAGGAGGAGGDNLNSSHASVRTLNIGN